MATNDESLMDALNPKERLRVEAAIAYIGVSKSVRSREIVQDLDGATLTTLSKADRQLINDAWDTLEAELARSEGIKIDANAKKSVGMRTIESGQSQLIGKLRMEAMSNAELVLAERAENQNKRSQSASR